MVNSFKDLKKEFLLSNILEIFSGLIFLIDRKGTYLDYYADSDLLYTSPELFLGKTIPEIMPEKSAEKQMYYLKQTFETKEVQSFYAPLKIDGTLQHFIANFVYYDDNSILSFVQDITQLEKVKTDLKESEELYHHLFSNAPLAIIIFDNEGYFVDVNEWFERTFGYKREELLGKSFLDLNIVSKELKPFLMERLHDLMNEKRIEPIEYEAKRKDGKKIWIRTNTSLISLRKKKLAMIISQDITERKKAEKKLQELNKMKSELIRRTSHELKTPLVSIKGFADLLLELYGNKLNKKIINIIEEIKQGCTRLQNLIRDILKTAQLESGKLELNKSKINLSKLIKKCVFESKGFIELRKLNIQLDLPNNYHIYAEKESLHQVISNLLVNAIKYTPSGGMIRVRMEVKEDEIQISISDTGIGLTVAEQEQLFTQFGKIEHFGQGMDINPEGSGLGLYICKQIINLHGGKIWVQSEGRNEGSTFYLTLPIEKFEDIN
ncbi:MAG: Signal transduction histidine kinase [Promethearchaeota archaeon]|nr:MAG: Signal transduction histidine kinase [Candidatus Lokiarchaeota archaeon]